MQDAEIAFGPGAEFRAIRRMIRRYGALASGIGDDAAVVAVAPGERIALSTDASVEGIHFRREWLTPREVANRATVAALSDLAAMGARGIGILAALAVPDAWRGALDALGDGIADAARDAEVVVLGGDVTGAAVLVLAITVVGALREGELLARAAARAGDRLYVTGRLGGPAAALAALERQESVPPPWRARFAAPRPRLAEARWLAGQGARAAIDISDGLVADAGHLAAASHVRAEIALDRLPLIDGVGAHDAARSGEEYELLVASPLPLDGASFVRRFGVPLTEIGVVLDGAPTVLLTQHGRPVALDAGGYDHFRRAGGPA